MNEAYRLGGYVEALSALNMDKRLYVRNGYVFTLIMIHKYIFESNKEKDYLI